MRKIIHLSDIRERGDAIVVWAFIALAVGGPLVLACARG